MNKKFWIGWLMLIGTLGLGCVKCGTQHAEKPQPQAQQIPKAPEFQPYILTKDKTETVEKDLIVFASDIQIDGTLKIKEGVNVALIAQGRLTINGQITGMELPSSPVSSRSLSSLFLSEAFAGDPSDWIMSGDHVYISPGSTISAPQGVDVAITTHDTSGDIVIKGTIKTPDGRNARNRNENGGNAGSIEIGTLRAGNHVESLGDKFGKKVKVDQPGLIKISGTLDGGNGGNGFNDEVGVDNGGDLDLRGTNGGNGGAINILAAKIDVSGATLSSGDGGNGGNAGAQTNAGTHAPDGKRDGEKGHDLTFVTGNGGKGGNIDLEVAGNQIEQGTVGRGGTAGSVYASAGNGGPWGKGGNTSGTLGNPGENGWYGSKVADTTPIIKPFAHFRNGGNGGDSNSAKHTGGDGGQIDVKGSDGKPVTLSDPLEIASYGNGGKGFNGCTASPRTDGTDGGDAFQNPSLLVRGSKYALDKHSFWGGDGGDGLASAGHGGIQGRDDTPHFIGDWGRNGKKCPPIKTASLIQDGPKVVSLPSETQDDFQKEPQVVSLPPQKVVKLVQTAPPSSETPGITLKHVEPNEPEIRNGFPVYRPLERPDFEEQIRAIPGQFDPRNYRRF